MISPNDRPIMKVEVLTLFPAMFAGPLDESILRRAQESGRLELVIHNLRYWTHDRHRKVLAVEKDSRCIPALEEIAAACPGRLQIIEGDALEVDPLAHLTPPIRIAANLPYNVGTELLVRWLTPTRIF